MQQEINFQNSQCRPHAPLSTETYPERGGILSPQPRNFAQRIDDVLFPGNHRGNKEPCLQRAENRNDGAWRKTATTVSKTKSDRAVAPEGVPAPRGSKQEQIIKAAITRLTVKRQPIKAYIW